MKRQIYIFILVFQVISFYGQSIQRKQPQIIKTYLINPYSTSFDSLGVLTETTFYNQKGNVIERIHHCENHEFNCSFDTLSFSTDFKYKYDSEGLLTDIIVYVNYIDKPIIVTTYTYIKDKMKRITKRVSLTSKSSDTLKTFETYKEFETYNYNKKGLLIKKQILEIPDPEHSWKRKTVEKFKYDKKDTCVRYDYVCKFRSNYYRRNHIDKWRKEFDEKGKLIEKTFSLQKGYWLKEKYVYNTKNQMNQILFWKDDENKYVLSTEKFYNDNDDAIKEIDYIVNGKGISRILKREYIYY